MDKFIIEGGHPLEGTVRLKGAKNAALPMMAAALLTRDPVTLHGVPDLSDIHTMGEILAELGCTVERKNGDLILQTTDEENCHARYEHVSTMRASVTVLGPLVGKRRFARVSQPGGCIIGVRPIDLHIKGLRALGAHIELEHGYQMARASRLRGTFIYLGGPYGSSVTGTENVMMAATLAEGVTVIENAACEPEVQELAHLLNAMGARIGGIGSPRLTIEGVRSLHGATAEIVSDRIEAGTFLAAAAISGGDVTLENVRADHLGAVTETFMRAGVRIQIKETSMRVISNGLFKPVDITTLPYPGFPTDLQAQTMAVLALADGLSIITEKIYPDRFMHVAELMRMGANIRKEGNCAIIQGVKELHGAPVMASDLRASAALVVAALAAKDKTEVRRVYHIDRGYEHIERRFNLLGAKIRRVVDKKMVLVKESA